MAHIDLYSTSHYKNNL